MHSKHFVLRAAAATTVTLFMTVGAVGPVNAAPNGNENGASQSASMSRANGGGSKAQGGGSSSADQGGASSSKADTADRGNRSGSRAGEAPKPDARTDAKADKRASGKSSAKAGKDGDNQPRQGWKRDGVDYEKPQPESKADKTDRGANAGNCEDGPKHVYCSTRDGSPSMNGNGKGEAKGKPCAGCVGKADNKNPKGQGPGPRRDGNNGYECDGNNGIGKTNPAHTGCTDGSDEPKEPKEPKEPECPAGTPACDEPTGGDECPEGDLNGDAEGCEAPKTDECPEGDLNGDAEGCEAPGEGDDDQGQGVDDGVSGDEGDTDEVLGVEMERSGPRNPAAFVEMERANRAPAEVSPVAAAPAAGFLPNTGAGQFGLALLAGLVLLAAGGAMLVLRRPQMKR